jgi:hypothetical protein
VKPIRKTADGDRRSQGASRGHESRRARGIPLERVMRPKVAAPLTVRPRTASTR